MLNIVKNVAPSPLCTVIARHLCKAQHPPVARSECQEIRDVSNNFATLYDLEARSVQTASGQPALWHTQMLRSSEVILNSRTYLGRPADSKLEASRLHSANQRMIQQGRVPSTQTIVARSSDSGPRRPSTGPKQAQTSKPTHEQSKLSGRNVASNRLLIPGAKQSNTA